MVRSSEERQNENNTTTLEKKQEITVDSKKIYKDDCFVLVEKKVAIVSSITDDTGMKNKGMKNLSMNVSPSSSNGKEENTTNEEESDNLV